MVYLPVPLLEDNMKIPGWHALPFCRGHQAAKAFRADLYVEECLPLYFHHFSDIISFVYFACKKVSLLAPEFQLLLIKMIWLWHSLRCCRNCWDSWDSWDCWDSWQLRQLRQFTVETVKIGYSWDSCSWDSCSCDSWDSWDCWDSLQLRQLQLW